MVLPAATTDRDTAGGIAAGHIAVAAGRTAAVAGRTVAGVVAAAEDKAVARTAEVVVLGHAWRLSSGA